MVQIKIPLEKELVTNKKYSKKLIFLFIKNIIQGKPLPVYVDRLYVKVHDIAIDMIFHKVVTGETYNISGFNEWKNIDLVKLLCIQMD